MQVEQGALLARRYRAEVLLGRGGMGEVWRCHDMEQRRAVAVKTVRPELLLDQGAARLFHAEVVATARMNHSGIVPVYDLVREGSNAVLVMAYRDGEPLSRMVGERPAWTVVRSVLEQILAALAYAHARGVLHLDVKPENVVVERRGATVRTTVLDFGIARVRRPGRGVERWFDQEALVGTVEYMAPEQCAGALERFGPWTDLYAVGTLAYELCAGARPFPTGLVLPSLMRRMGEPAPRLEPVVTGVPRGFPALVADLLATEPRERPWCAADVLQRLADLEGDGDGACDAGTPKVERGAYAVPGPPRQLHARESLAIDASGGRAEEAFTADADAPLPGAYGLFGLRELPVLGRVDERRALWNAVRRSVLAKETSLVLLEGPVGVGKTRLARDALERAAELGLAVTMETSWSAEGSGDEGLRALLENTLDTRGATLEGLQSRLSHWLERLPADVEDHATFRREVELLLRPPPGAQPDGGLPLRVALDALALASSIRPVILFLDDVQWSRGQAVALAEALLARKDRLPVCVVATARVEEDEERAASTAFTALPGALEIRMERLAPESTKGLVRGLLDVDDELCRLLAERAEGNPLFVTQLIGQLLLDDAIERRDGRFRLARAVDLDAVPADIAAVWDRRVARSGAGARELSALAVVREKVSLELAAELGEAIGPSLDASIQRALEAGLLFLDDGEYRWAHGLLRTFLVRQIEPDDTAPLAEAAARALALLVGREDVQEERARHLREAGQGRDACAALLAAGRWSFHHAEPSARKKRFAALAAWGDEYGYFDVSARAQAELAFVAAEGADAAGAEQRVAEARARLDREGGGAARAWVEFQAARAARLGGRLDEGMRATQAALEAARRDGVVEVEALALTAQGVDHYRRGEHAEAQRLLLAAAERHRAAESPVGEAQALLQMSSLHASGQAVGILDRAIAISRASGALRVELMARQLSIWHVWATGDRVRANAEAREVLGQAERRSLRQTACLVELICAVRNIIDGDWDAATRHRDGAMRWGADRGAVTERVHLAAIELALAAHHGLPDEAEERFRDLERARSGYTDGAMKETLIATIPLVCPDLAAALRRVCEGGASDT